MADRGEWINPEKEKRKDAAGKLKETSDVVEEWDPTRVICFQVNFIKPSCQDCFLVQHTQTAEAIPNGHIMHTKCITNGPKNTKISYDILKVFFSRPSKFYQNWDFWFANIPSGNSVNIDFFIFRFSAFK
jgi:hypothetical protein